MNPLVGDVSYFIQDPLHSGDVVFEPHVQISVSDAQQRGIVDGDLVRVFNEQGEMQVHAIVSSTITPGVAIVPDGVF